MKLKSALCLLAILSVFTFASMYLTLPAKAASMTIEFLNHWTEPSEVYYWANVTKEYNEHYAPPGVEIRMTSVEFDILYDTIMTRHAAGQDPDIMHIHAMWIPTFANWKSHILAVPPPEVQADVKANWTQVTVAGSTFKGYVWGYPSEFNSWALVYNRHLFEEEIAARTGTVNGTFLSNMLTKLDNDDPLTWSELVVSAQLLTKYTAGKISQTGFVPFIEGMPEEQRYQFMSLLWSNGGEYLDLNAPKVLFNSTKGTQVMELYHNLGYVYGIYDPLNIPDYWWNAYALETLAMCILPTWMTYVRDAMPGFFDHLGVAPIPIGQPGLQSTSATYNWINTVSQRAADEGRATAAWEFLKWINKKRPQYDVPLPGAMSIGSVPKGNGASIMGDYLIRDSIVPSRIDDQSNGRLTVVDGTGHGVAGSLISEDFWFNSFMKMGGPPYGRSDISFLKTKEVQYEIGQMFEKVTLTGSDPAATMAETAAKVQALLPMPGDINIDGVVSIYDAVHMIKDIDATPLNPLWNRGRSDINNDLRVSGSDVTILSTNYGRTGGY